MAAGRFVAEPRGKVGSDGGEGLPNFRQSPPGQMVFRTYDAERGPDFSGMVADGGGHAADSGNVLLIVQGKTGCPDAGQLPSEGGGGSDGLRSHPVECGAGDDAGELLLGQARGKDFPHCRAVDRSPGPDFLDDADRTVGLPFCHERDDAIAEHRKTGALSGSAA